MKELVQLLLNTVVEKRVFASFSEFKSRDVENSQMDLTKLKEGLVKDSTYQAIVASGVDPKEIRQMLEKAFDEAQLKLKQKIFGAFDAIFA